MSMQSPTLNAALCGALLLIGPAACTSKFDAPSPATGPDGRPGSVGDRPRALDGRVFLSMRITEGGVPRALVDDTRLSLGFREGSRVGADAGCNSLGGRYAVDRAELVITNAGITKMACDDARLAQDEWYFGFLQSSPSLVLDGNALVLDGGGTRLEYLDREEATPDVELTGHTWKVDTIIQGGGAHHAAWPKPATLVFATDGSLAIDTGCNTGSAKYRLSGKELSFTSPATTKVHCESPLPNQEDALLGLLRGPQPVTWEITVDRLSLRGKDIGLDLVASGG
jgi:heat shock protein HslJ